MFGDIAGNVNILTFLSPKVSLYDKIYKPLKRSLEISWDHLGAHKEFISFYSINVINQVVIQSIKFIQFNRTLIVSTGNQQKSLIIIDPESKKKEYLFNLHDVRFKNL